MDAVEILPVELWTLIIERYLVTSASSKEMNCIRPVCKLWNDIVKERVFPMCFKPWTVYRPMGESPLTPIDQTDQSPLIPFLESLKKFYITLDRN